LGKTLTNFGDRINSFWAQSWQF